jgi:hypothetical protein
LEELAGALGESVEEGGRGLLGTLRAVVGVLVLNRGRAEHRSSRRRADCCSSGLDLFDQPSDESPVVFGSEMTPAGQGREEVEANFRAWHLYRLFRHSRLPGVMV